MPVCAPRGCGCSLTGPGVQSGSGESGSPYYISTGGAEVVTSLTRPFPPFQGQQIYETDTGLSYTYVSSTWVLTSDPYGLIDPVVCQVSQSAAQSIPNNAATIVLFDTEDLDPYDYHSTSLNTGRITPLIAGWYEVTVAFDWQSDTDYTRRLVEVHKNGAALTPTRRHDPGSSGIATGVLSATIVSGLIQMNGSTDYFTISAFQVNTSAGNNTLRAVLCAKLIRET